MCGTFTYPLYCGLSPYIFVYARSEGSGESAHLRFDSRQRAPVISLMGFVSLAHERECILFK